MAQACFGSFSESLPWSDAAHFTVVTFPFTQANEAKLVLSLSAL
jgi:hypothetical protein